MHVHGLPAVVRPEPDVDLVGLHELGQRGRDAPKQRTDLRRFRLAELPHVKHVPFRFDNERPDAQWADTVLDDPVFRDEDLAAGKIDAAGRQIASETPFHRAKCSRTTKGRSRGPSWKLIRRRPTLPGGCPPSTIGAGGLNCSVRNGKRCTPAAITAENCQARVHPQNSIAAPTCSKSRPRAISTGPLNALLRLHVPPIDVVVSHGPYSL